MVRAQYRRPGSPGRESGGRRFGTLAIPFNPCCPSLSEEIPKAIRLRHSNKINPVYDTPIYDCPHNRKKKQTQGSYRCERHHETFEMTGRITHQLLFQFLAVFWRNKWTIQLFQCGDKCDNKCSCSKSCNHTVNNLHSCHCFA